VTGHRSLRVGGLNWESVPLRLFRAGNDRFWNAADLDFEGDLADWRGLDERQRRGVAYLCAMFAAGDEALTGHLWPFLRVAADAGRLDDQLYLAQVGLERARHTEGFRRWLDAVGLTGDLTALVADNPGYREVVGVAVPAAVAALAADPSPANQVRACVTYHHVAAGVLALTGYQVWSRVCVSDDILPGMQELVRRVVEDERRHLVWATHTCRRLVAADDGLWAVAQQQVADLLPAALAAIEWVFGQFDEPPFRLRPAEFTDYATDRVRRRLAAIGAARGVSPDQLDRADRVPEDLEDALHALDRVVNRVDGGVDASGLALTAPW
jgi:ribonucleoside-diphosphate reductase beta chain